MEKVLVFDLGGTLMEYKGMPDSWVDFYKQGFEALNSYYHCGVSAAGIDKSVEILKSFNPRFVYREVEYTPEYIFSNAGCRFVQIDRKQKGIGDICDLTEVFTWREKSS